MGSRSFWELPFQTFLSCKGAPETQAGEARLHVYRTIAQSGRVCSTVNAGTVVGTE